MLSIMKKRVGFLTISLIWLLPAILPEIQAQQTATPPSTAAASPAISIQELKTKRAAIESMTDIDATLKTDSLNYIDRAISYIELTASTNKRVNELTQLIQTAPARLKILQAALKKPFVELKEVGARAQQMSTLKLEQRMRQKEAEHATAQSRLREWSDRLTAEKDTINQIAEQLAAATSRLNDIQTELKTTSGAAATDILNDSKVLSLKSEREKITAEIKLNEQRQRSHNLLVELFSTERDVAQKAVESRQKIWTTWQAEVQKRRQQEAAQAVEDAQDAIVKTPLLPKIIQEQFDINIQLSTDLETITREEALFAKKNEGYQSRLKALEQEFETAKKRVESAVLTAAIGLALRTQRLKLPSADQYFADSDARQIRMSEISEHQIELDHLLREISDPRALTDRLLGSVSFQSDVERKSLDLKIQESLANRIDIIEKLRSGYDRIFKLIQDIEFTEQKLVTTAEDFGKLLDRHLLWIRSSKPVGFRDIQKLQVSLGWFFKPPSWGQFFRDMGQTFSQKTALWIIGLLIGLSLIISRGWAKRKLKDIAECVEQQVEDSFFLTIKALGLTVVLAAVWPFLLAFPAIQLTGLSQPDPFSAGIAGGLIYASRPLFFLLLAYNICRQHGLAQVHFQWPGSARRTLKHNLGWLIPIVGLTSFFLGAMVTVPQFEYSDALAKLNLMIQALAISLFMVRSLRFRGGITSVLIEKHPQSWLCRLRYVWYPAAILVPLSILYLALIGYYYSAFEIRIFARDTTMLLLILIVFNDLVLRMLMRAQRKIALKKAILAQQQKKESISDSDSGLASAATDDDQASLLESVIGMSAIDEQTRTLLKTVIFILALAGMWAIWEPVFPAFGILQDVELWSYTRVVDGITQTVPTTLANIAISVIVIVITIIAVRNLPGLLEMILLNRLPMDPGARYAYSAVCRYAITALGIVIALNAMGLRWSNLQWLIAALSVGLGFGLQEIVANFVSGLIVLFERPFRVGDTVTVGEVHGTVTRIRIRATTILDWDRKELIVPNKEFITGRLINWSLSDHIIRIKVPVGIAYGSDTDLAEQLLLKAAKTNSLVLKSPEPIAVFLRFGDNTLNFELRVYIKSIDDWIPMLHKMNRTIDKEFRQAGITIAFPQRDVHLDATGPLEVRVVSEEPSGSKAGKKSSAAQKEPGG
jgi:potassium efflux system protein